MTQDPRDHERNLDADGAADGVADGGASDGDGSAVITARRVPPALAHGVTCGSPAIDPWLNA